MILLLTIAVTAALTWLVIEIVTAPTEEYPGQYDAGAFDDLPYDVNVVNGQPTMDVPIQVSAPPGTFVARPRVPIPWDPQRITLNWNWPVPPASSR